MNLDALTIAAVRDELAERLLDGRVQRVVQPAELALGIEIYAGERYQLLLSAETEQAGALLAEVKLRRGREAPSPMLLLLRKYAHAARLVAITQAPLERVLTFSLRGPEGDVDLVCEAMGRLSNVILVDAEGRIMDALKRVPGSINRVRTVLPHQPYVPPPPQAKDSPLGVTAARLGDLLAQGEGPAWRRLVDGISAISPLLGREIVYRATGSLTPPLPLDDHQQRAVVRVLDELWHLPQSKAWAPCVGYEGEGAERRPRVCAPYRLTHLPDVADVASISEAVLMVREAQGAIDPYQQVRVRLHAALDEQVQRHQARLASLREAHIPESEIELLQMQGNAILAMGWSLKHGQAELVVNPIELGLAEEGTGIEELRIPLDPALSPADNAQDYFRRYRKRRDAADQVPELMGESERELDYLRQLAAEVDLAEDRAQLDEVEAEQRAAGYLTERKHGATSPASQPLRARTPEGDLILIGRNSQQNHELTFKRAGPDDLWLHAHGVPGSHVIVKVGGGALSDTTLLRAAQLAAYYSTARPESRVLVDWVARRHVHPMKNGRPGMVVYTHEQTLMVTPEPLDPDEQD